MIRIDRFQLINNEDSIKEISSTKSLGTIRKTIQWNIKNE